VASTRVLGLLNDAYYILLCRILSLGDFGRLPFSWFGDAPVRVAFANSHCFIARFCYFITGWRAGVEGSLIYPPHVLLFACHDSPSYSSHSRGLGLVHFGPRKLEKDPKE
jgi:hypothetical protein